jgi:hypothetical protein
VDAGVQAWPQLLPAYTSGVEATGVWDTAAGNWTPLGAGFGFTARTLAGAFAAAEAAALAAPADNPPPTSAATLKSMTITGRELIQASPLADII